MHMLSGVTVLRHKHVKRPFKCSDSCPISIKMDERVRGVAAALGSGLTSWASSAAKPSSARLAASHGAATTHLPDRTPIRYLKVRLGSQTSFNQCQHSRSEFAGSGLSPKAGKLDTL